MLQAAWTLIAALERMQDGVTVHGFRSSFRTWAAERTNYPREICEVALAHTVATKRSAPISGTLPPKAGCALPEAPQQGPALGPDRVLARHLRDER